MLMHINLKNFVLVDELSLELADGFHAFTGETGAGKSILLDAINLALGTRAEARFVKSGSARCDINLNFDISDQPDIQQWLEQNELDDDGECLLRRSIYADGKSRATINGHPSPLHLLKELGQHMLQVHGQHQHQLLLKPKYQQHLFDQYGLHQDILKKLDGFYLQYQEIDQQIQLLLSKKADRDDQLSLYEYQHSELEQAAIEDDEWQTLHQEHQRLHQSKSLISALNQAIECTAEGESTSALALLQQAMDQLNSVGFSDEQLDSAKALLNTACIHAQEAESELNSYRQSLDLSPERLQQIEQRLNIISDLARKHHVEPEALKEVQVSLQQKVEQLKNLDEHLIELEQQQQTILSDYKKVATKLTNSRKKLAKSLAKTITTLLSQLNMADSQFAIELISNDSAISATGQESIQFTLSSNPGQPLAPLQKVASGGELSRICLAILASLAGKQAIPTLIFDEIDTGISGKTADTVAKLLKQISQSLQIMCVTHLPQVASQAKHHYRVEKQVKGKSTTTTITKLDNEQRIHETARLLAGETINKQALANAKALLMSC
ncbi:MAG: DNA repair protein RecN [Coxiellaceae bacterium]|nr:DNA repair protein RecN [Coxiellaceae bacterium]